MQNDDLPILLRELRLPPLPGGNAPATVSPVELICADLRAELVKRGVHASERPLNDVIITEWTAPPQRLDEGQPYYGPTRDARAAINQLLGLPADAKPDQWEAQLSDRGKLEAILDALADHSLDVEQRSAIALLLLDTLDRTALHDRATTETLTRIRWLLRRDEQVHARMRYWWAHMDGGALVMEALS